MQFSLAIFIPRVLILTVSLAFGISVEAKCTALSADYVIIGGGTAGIAMASRLSVNNSVILLEAGQNEDTNPLVTDPTNSRIILNFFNEFFWALGQNEPGDSGGRVFQAVAGELLGGGSSVNGMQYVRSTASYFSNLQTLLGDPAWGPTNTLEVFKNIETFTGVPGFYNPAVHGTSGPISVRQAVKNDTAANDYVQALVSLGYPEITDYNDPATPIGAYLYWQLTEQPALTRESSSTAYFGDVLVQQSDNIYKTINKPITLYTKARVENILFSNNSGPTARGVRAIVNGSEHVFQAKKKVILCAGFQSPYLLMLSGIGDGTALANLGIPVVYDNPNVGQSMLNHPSISLTGTGNVPSGTIDPEGLYSGGAFLADPTQPSDTDRGFQIIGIALPNAINPTQGLFTTVGILLNSLSEGNIFLNADDPLRVPRYNFNYFSNPADLASAVELYTIMYDSLDALPWITSISGPAPSSGEVEAWILDHYDQAYHWTGSCRMAQTPADGVTDSSGNVFGVNNLVIADTSIAPLNFRGNTQAWAYLAANIIASKILAGQ